MANADTEVSFDLEVSKVYAHKVCCASRAGVKGAPSFYKRCLKSFKF